MKNIHLKKSDYTCIMQNLLAVTSAFSSTRRRIYLSKLNLTFSSNDLECDFVCKAIKYFKQLLREVSSVGKSDVTRILAEIVEILQKYV